MIIQYVYGISTLLWLNKLECLVQCMFTVGVSGQERDHKKTRSKNAKITKRLIPVEGSDRPILLSLPSMRKNIKNEEKRDTSVYFVRNQCDSYIQGRKNTLAFSSLSNGQRLHPQNLTRELSNYKLYKYK